MGVVTRYLVVNPDLASSKPRLDTGQVSTGAGLAEGTKYVHSCTDLLKG